MSATLGDINLDAVRYFLNAAVREGRINKSARDLSIEQLLRRLHLINEENGLREMLCNNLIHKCYTGTFIQMKVFDDYITLCNGGTLPPGYTVERLMEPHESHPRNLLMANVFYLTGFIEVWGRGYEKIREAFEKEKQEVPVFEEVWGACHDKA